MLFAVRVPIVRFVAAVGAVASTLNAADVPSVKASPLVRLAVSVTPVPAEDKVTPVIVTEFVPAAIVPVVVPPIVPPPVFANEIAVASVTFPALLLLSCACTVTLNVLPAVGVVGVIEVMASLVGGEDDETEPYVFTSFVLKFPVLDALQP
jgi:hypothetical protein